MAGLDYRKLYELQDRVLSAVFSVEKEFYLTGCGDDAGPWTEDDAFPCYNWVKKLKA